MEMKELVFNFPVQIADAIRLANSHFKLNQTTPIHNVVISGLGGSGIGGTIVSDLLSNLVSVPIIVSKDYILPNFINENTLVIISSYSGNTEETLSSLNQAELAGSIIACVTSGGKVLEQAKGNNWTYFQVPSGFPPRSCLGYSMVQLFGILRSYGLINDLVFQELDSIPQYLKEHQEELHKLAKSLAEKIKNTIPVIYSSAPFEGVAVRLRQQLNENSKMLAWHHIVPEMNHNEIVAWVKAYSSLSVLFIRHSFENTRTSKRIEFLRGVLDGLVDTYSFEARGKSRIIQAFYAIHWGDILSVELADLHHVDAMDIAVIDKLKSHLAEF